MTENTPLPLTLKLVLSNEAGGGRIVVPLESYLDFDENQSRQLEELVDRWAPLAAPASNRPKLRSSNPASRI